MTKQANLLTFPPTYRLEYTHLRLGPFGDMSEIPPNDTQDMKRSAKDVGE